LEKVSELGYGSIRWVESTAANPIGLELSFAMPKDVKLLKSKHNHEHLLIFGSGSAVGQLIQPHGFPSAKDLINDLTKLTPKRMKDRKRKKTVAHPIPKSVQHNALYFCIQFCITNMYRFIMSKNFKSELQRVKQAKSKTKLVAVRLPADLYEKVERLKKQTGVSASKIIILAVQKAVSEST
jgi:hypothetical protein